MKRFLSLALLLVSASSFSQKAYRDSLAAFRNSYIQTHDVVQGEDRKALRFFPIDPAYRVTAGFEKAKESQWLSFPTSGKISKVFRVYGTLFFRLSGRALQLRVYQSQALMTTDEYRDYLFLPFTDATTGVDSYEGGRYLDMNTKEFENSTVMVDFNKAYNPSCAYVSGRYNCPIPPKENSLPVAVRAGEKNFGKPHR